MFYRLNNHKSYRSKIIFSNGKETKKIRILTTKEVSTLTSDGLNNLNILLNYSDGTFSNSTIIEVPKGATDLYNTLKKLVEMFNISIQINQILILVNIMKGEYEN
ncbi:hypothetical protein [Mycoplasmopsis cynos]|uniref:hypothetical protein n=1 Tax=Mycoplasmopsis cynos TaxID=171284 RepID=UPI0024C9BA12|nr:hypothetical protein [Mycoplasmopsis cynos]WAM07664.1 hypothetical protein ONA21_06090 [Mycoplasmopsis cynos]